MNNQTIDSILKYYLEYEINQILTSSEIQNSKECINCLKNDFKDTKKVQEIYNTLKFKYIEEKIKKFLKTKIINEEANKKLILNVLKDFSGNKLAEETAISEIVKTIKNNLRNNKSLKDETIQDFAIDLCEEAENEEFNIYIDIINHTFMSKSNKMVTKKMPLYIAKCRIEGEQIVPNNIIVNIETLTIILSVLLDKDKTEINLDYEKQIREFDSAIKELEENLNLEHAMEICYDLFNTYFNFSKSDIENINTKNANYRLLNQYILSINDLTKDSIRNIKEDIELLKRVISQDLRLPTTMKKYLLGNNKFDELDNIDNQKFYYGSYPCEYDINQTQYKIVNAIKNNDLIAVEGPPGTGKTSLLKEIIANIVVERANLILKNWKNPVNPISYGTAGNIYEFDWFDQNKDIIKSVVVSSKNREAINNIQKEVNGEIKYFSEIAKDYEAPKIATLGSFKGLVCLPLGNSKNLQAFNKFLYSSYIPGLKELEIDEEQVKSQYIEKKKEIDDLNNLAKILKNELGKEEYNTDLNKMLEVLENKQKELTNRYKEYKIKKEDKSQELAQIEAQEASYNNIVEETTKKLTKLKLEQENLKEVKQKMESLTFLQKLILDRKFYNKYKNQNINESLILLATNIDNLEKKKDSNINEITKLVKPKIKIKAEYDEILKEIEQLKNQINHNLHKSNIIKKVEEFNTKFLYSKHNKKTNTDEIHGYFKEYNNLLDIYCIGKIHLLNQELFTLALQLHEAYIIKNKNEIINNLKLFMEQNDNLVFKKFYDSTFMYNDAKKNALLKVWQTIFLCFPVITTTLDSFCKKLFQMIPEYIDLTLIDESGQILPHNLVPALYRTKKAIIVGDIHQLEPIYSASQKDFTQNANEIGPDLYQQIKIEGNSVQALANRNTDVKENNEPIILNKHFRCEKNIAEFANKYVYKNKLSIVNENNFDKAFYNNLVAFDIRGNKDKDKHYNLAEAQACIKAIKSIAEKLNENPNKISAAIITPFASQRDLILELLEKEDIKNIKVGTIHAFQGQQEDYIIFSQVIDSLKPAYLSNFIGGKCNLLNVAITRAKKQFIFVGNLECAFKSNNYLAKLINYIEQVGEIYSLFLEKFSEHNFEPQILDILTINQNLKDDKLGEYIRKHSNYGIIEDAENHYNLLIYALENLNKNMFISSPWINNNVINDSVLALFESNIEKGRDIKINYGYKKIKDDTQSTDKIVESLSAQNGLGYTKKEDMEQLLKRLKDILGNNLISGTPSHKKILIVDDYYLLIGSHNWLSNAGKTPVNQRAEEISIVSTNQETIQYLKNRYFKGSENIGKF